jgi:hypothetical protein
MCYGWVEDTIYIYDVMTGTLKPVRMFTYRQIPCEGVKAGAYLSRKLWQCTGKCQCVNYSMQPNAPAWLFGQGTGTSQNDACRNAKRDAEHNAPKGTYGRHCRCLDCNND